MFFSPLNSVTKIPCISRSGIFYLSAQPSISYTLDYIPLHLETKVKNLPRVKWNRGSQTILLPSVSKIAVDSIKLGWIHPQWQISAPKRDTTYSDGYELSILLF